MAVNLKRVGNWTEFEGTAISINVQLGLQIHWLKLSPRHLQFTFLCLDDYKHYCPMVCGLPDWGDYSRLGDKWDLRWLMGTAVGRCQTESEHRWVQGWCWQQERWCRRHPSSSGLWCGLGEYGYRSTLTTSDLLPMLWILLLSSWSGGVLWLIIIV